MSQGSFYPNIRFLGQKAKGVSCSSFTDTYTGRVTTEATLSGFQDFFLQPIIKGWSNFIPQLISFSKVLPTAHAKTHGTSTQNVVT